MQKVKVAKSGEMVQITPDCNGRFSILSNDMRLSLQEALNHLKPPFSMRTVSNCDILFVSAVTVEKVHKEHVFVGMMKATEGISISDVSTFSRMAEVPVSLNLTVVTMVPKQQEILDWNELASLMMGSLGASGYLLDTISALKNHRVDRRPYSHPWLCTITVMPTASRKGSMVSRLIARR